MKLLRTIRFDDSDDRVFGRAAGSGEWAVSGAFAFAGLCEDDLVGKRRQAFANGFLSVESFARSTFAVVAEMSVDDAAMVTDALRTHLLAEHGAPDMAAAGQAAADEIAFVADLCAEAPINTVFTVRRELGDDGRIHESFRTIQPPTADPRHSRVWTVVDD